jgi:hypothetical protein
MSKTNARVGDWFRINAGMVEKWSRIKTMSWEGETLILNGRKIRPLDPLQIADVSLDEEQLVGIDWWGEFNDCQRKVSSNKKQGSLL